MTFVEMAPSLCRMSTEYISIDEFVMVLLFVLKGMVVKKFV